MKYTHSFIAQLNDRAIIRVGGEQRFEYLHGQLTVATNQTNPNAARLSAHCDFKGKMFSALVVSELDDSFLLGCDKQAAEESVVQLKKYGVFSKVEIEIDNDLSSFGVYGADHIQHLRALFLELNESHLAVTSNEYGQAICFNDVNLRFLCYLNNKGVDRLQNIIKIKEFASEVFWEAIEIEAGIADIKGNNIGQFVPQMLNFQAIDAIDFDKGCYMGQEVVARTKFLGKNKRASFILQGIDESALAISAGDTVEIKMGDNWRRAGTVLRSASIQTEPNTVQISALAVMANDTSVGSVVRLKNSDVELSVLPLPYKIEDA